MELADLGARIVLLARNKQSLQAVVEELPSNQGQQHAVRVADFSSPDLVKETIGNFVASGQTAEILVNNTGGPPGGLAIEADVSQFMSGFQNHLACNQHLVQALLPGMKAASYGRVVNVISTSVKQPIPGLGVSNTIRGAVASWAKTLAWELGSYGVTVNNVLPGFTDTSRLQSILRSRADTAQASQQQIADQFLASVPAGRFGDPSEVGAAIAFLCSPAAGYINGINLPVDGGRTQCL